MTEEIPLPKSLRQGMGPDGPKSFRLILARGGIPLGSTDRLGVLATLAQDPDEEVKSEAIRGLAGLSEEFLTKALADQSLHEEILEALSVYHASVRTVIALILAHQNLAPETIARYAQTPDPELLDILANNQRALSKYPQVAAELLKNELLKPDVGARIQSLFGEAEEEEELPPQEIPEELKDIESIELPADLPESLLDDDVGESDSKNIYAIIQKLTITEKIKLATLGSKSARRLLSKDPNRAIVNAVIRSPKLREDEVILFAQDKQTPEDILLYIFLKKEWMKNYQVRYALCQNPKAPTAKTIRLVDTLYEKELKTLAKSRNVPHIISSTALRALHRKAQKKS